jgi:hypothetical protein
MTFYPHVPQIIWPQSEHWPEEAPLEDCEPHSQQIIVSIVLKMVEQRKLVS